jgi:hypothetical protein
MSDRLFIFELVVPVFFLCVDDSRLPKDFIKHYRRKEQPRAALWFELLFISFSRQLETHHLLILGDLPILSFL